jgi:hypothetical protein
MTVFSGDAHSFCVHVANLLCSQPFADYVLAPVKGAAECRTFEVALLCNADIANLVCEVVFKTRNIAKCCLTRVSGWLLM